MNSSEPRANLAPPPSSRAAWSSAEANGGDSVRLFWASAFWASARQVLDDAAAGRVHLSPPPEISNRDHLHLDQAACGEMG